MIYVERQKFCNFNYMSTQKKKNSKNGKKESPPVYFMDLEVEGVKCFKAKQILDLSDGSGKPARWTVILGDNGTGKTTLLQCLIDLFPTKNFNVNENENENVLVPIGIAKIRIASLKLKHNLITGIYNESSTIGCSYFSIGNFEDNELIKGHGFKVYEKPTEKDDIIQVKTINDDRVENLLIYPYSASRKSGLKNGFTSSYTDLDFFVKSFFKDNFELINAEEWLLQAKFASQNAKSGLKIKLEKKYKEVKDILKKLLPDVSDFRVKPITESQTEAIIQAKTFYGWVDMKNLSLGYQTLIAWMVDLAARLFERYPDSKNPLAEPAVVLVDEIDLHLHPKWQRTLINHLTNIFSQTQFIVTAHSPLIVQSAEDANIVLLKREGDRVKIYNNKDENVIKGWRVDQVLTSDLFGLESTYPQKYDAYLKRREELLNKKKLTKKNEKELEEIGKKLDELDVSLGEKNNDALEALQKAAAVLKSNR